MSIYLVKDWNKQIQEIGCTDSAESTISPSFLTALIRALIHLSVTFLGVRNIIVPVPSLELIGVDGPFFGLDDEGSEDCCGLGGREVLVLDCATS